MASRSRKQKSITKSMAEEVQINKKRWKDSFRQMENIDAGSSVKTSVAEVLDSSSLTDANQTTVMHVKVFHENLLDTLEAVLENGWHPLVLNCATTEAY